MIDFIPLENQSREKNKIDFMGLQDNSSTAYPFEKENDLEREIERNQARLTSRGIETVAGLPGDIESFFHHVFGGTQALPTSSKLQEKSEKLSKGYLAPKTEFEKKSDTLMKDISAFSIGGPGGFARTLGIPLAATGVEESLKHLNASDRSAAYGKIGTMLALDLARIRKGAGGSAQSFANGLFKKAEHAIPEGATVDATKLKSSLDVIRKELESGGFKPSTKGALDKIRELESQIKDGKIEVKWLVDNRHAINEMIKEGGGFGFAVPKDIKKKIFSNLNKVKKTSINALEEYGEKQNPEFLKYYRPANEAYAAVQGSNLIENFMKKHFSKFLEGKHAGYLFGLGTSTALGAAKGILSHPAATGIGGAVAAPAYQAIKIFLRMKKSPTLRKYYSEIINGSLKGNISQVASNLEGLEAELKRQEQFKD